jgi:uncharacterized protein (DUF58 family)
MQLSPALRQRLGRAKLVAPGVLAAGGVGERPSAQRGEGIEFEEHRPYQPGDDARRIDPNLYARWGAPFVREYNVGQQLTVTLLLDASRSMEPGTPAKLDVARSIATGLAFVALAGSDAVQSGVWSGDRLWWQPRRSGSGRIDDLERWWASFRPKGRSDLVTAVRRVRPELPKRGLTILISDLWSDEAEAAIDALAAAGQALLVVQVLAEEEVHPERYSGGSLRMVDVESGDEVDVSLGAPQIDRYRALLGGWTDELRQRTSAVRGRFVRVSNDETAEHVFLRTLPGVGVLR